MPQGISSSSTWLSKIFYTNLIAALLTDARARDTFPLRP
jgi:hypothetical protein